MRGHSAFIIPQNVPISIPWQIHRWTLRSWEAMSESSRMSQRQTRIVWLGLFRPPIVRYTVVVDEYHANLARIGP
jgi:hypothetical protein